MPRPTVLLADDHAMLLEAFKTLLESPVPLPLPALTTGIEGLYLVAGAPDQQRFFRLYPEHSTRLSESLALSPANLA